MCRWVRVIFKVSSDLVTWPIANERRAQIRRNGTYLASSGLVFHQTPRTVFGQKNAAATRGGEGRMDAIRRERIAHVETVEPHLLAASADVDDAINRPANVPALAGEQILESFDRERHAARRELHETEDAFRGHEFPFLRRWLPWSRTR